MSRGLDITLVSTGNDWDALYINGKAVMQAHSITMEDVLEYLGIAVTISRPTVDDEWFDEYADKYGQLPDNLVDVKTRE